MMHSDLFLNSSTRATKIMSERSSLQSECEALYVLRRGKMERFILLDILQVNPDVLFCLMTLITF